MDEKNVLMNRKGIHTGVCLHNGIVHKNKDEWTVDDCTECTCQVRTQDPADMYLSALSLSH